MRRLVSLLLIAASGVSAQTDWHTVEPALGIALPIDGGFGPEWGAGPGVAARLEAPAYGGTVRLGLRSTPYESQETALPEFLVLAATLGWGPAIVLPSGLRLSAGPEIGVLHLRFDDEDGRFGGNLQNETEASVGAWARLDAPLIGRLRAWTEAEVARVAFAEPATIATASAGLALRLDTPRWLRGVLR